MSSVNNSKIVWQPSPLVNLHSDPFAIVLNDCDLRDIESLACTCKQINQFVSQSALWEWLAAQEGYNIQNSQYPKMDYKIEYYNLKEMKHLIENESDLEKKDKLQAMLFSKTESIIEQIIDHKYTKPNKESLEKVVNLLTQMSDSAWKEDFLIKTIDKFCELGLVERAISLFNLLPNNDVRVEKKIFESIVNYCELSKLDVAEAFLPKIMSKNYLHGDALCILVSRYVEKGNIESLNKAKSLGSEMNKRYVKYGSRINFIAFLSDLFDKYCENCEIGSLNEGIDILFHIGSIFRVDEFYTNHSIIKKQLIKYGKKENNKVKKRMSTCLWC